MENKCNSCFYALMDKDLQAPCITCTGYSNFVNGRLYMTEHLPATLEEAIDDWFHEGAPMKYDTVSKPKHYMLFEDEGIECIDSEIQYYGPLEITLLSETPDTELPQPVNRSWPF